MKITFLGIGFDATLLLQMLEQKVPAHYLGISSEPIDPEGYKGDKIRFCMQPSVEAAALRILPKIKKRTKGTDVVFLLSKITGKSKEDIVCNIAEGLEDSTVVSIVWYAKQKHGQRGVSNTLERLGACSSVVAIPHASFTKLPELVAEYVEQILFMYKLPYVNADSDIGKRTLGKGGLLHLMLSEILIDDLNPTNERLPWVLSCINYNPDLDTLLDYGHSALLHLTVSQGTSPAIIQYICEYVFSCLGEEGEFNFSITVTSKQQDSVGIELLVTDTVTQKETEFWF